MRRVGTVTFVQGPDKVVDVDGQSFLMSAAIPVAPGFTVEVDEHRSNILRVVADQPLPNYRLRSTGAGDRDLATPLDLVHHTLDDFKGADGIRARARELVSASFENLDTLRNLGVEPVKGALFWGPPGTGKTMLAMAIAKQVQGAFFHIKGPEIFASLVGQSEETIRRLFATARQTRKAVIFFDEIDSVATKRAGSGSHEVSKKVVGQLLTEMDATPPGAGVLIIAATNLVDDIDPALMRAGRFTWKLEFTLPDQDQRLSILTHQAAGVVKAEALPLDKVAAATEGWSPAELKAIWTEAGMVCLATGRTALTAADLDAGLERARTVGRR